MAYTFGKCHSWLARFISSASVGGTQPDEMPLGRGILSAEAQAGNDARRGAALPGSALAQHTLEDVDRSHELRRRTPPPRPAPTRLLGHLPHTPTCSAIALITINRKVNIMARKKSKSSFTTERTS